MKTILTIGIITVCLSAGLIGLGIGLIDYAVDTTHHHFYRNGALVGYTNSDPDAIGSDSFLVWLEQEADSTEMSILHHECDDHYITIKTR